MADRRLVWLGQPWAAACRATATRLARSASSHATADSRESMSGSAAVCTGSFRRYSS